eukprot:30957-Pelagococcus_subviridis.AAC.8
MPSIRLSTSAHNSADDPLIIPSTRLEVVHSATTVSAVSDVNAPLANGRYGLFTLSNFLSYS